LLPFQASGRRGKLVSDIPSDQEKHAEELAPELPVNIPSGTIYSYNLGESERPEGLKVRYKIRVVTGPEADRHEARLAEALGEALVWTRRNLMD
jgi:hypothetical protein